MRTPFLALLAMATPVFGAAANDRFDNQLSSPLVVSPAQIHMVRQRNVRIEAGVATEAEKTEVEAIDSGTIATGRASRVFGSAVVAAEDKHLRLGVTGDVSAIEALVRATGAADVTSRGKRSRLAPMIAVELTPVVLGVRGTIEQASLAETATAAARTATSARLDFGVMFQINGMEGGAGYAPRSEARVSTETASSDLPGTTLATEARETLPASFVVHGRARVAPIAAFGMQYRQTSLAELPPEATYLPASKDLRALTLTSEIALGIASLEGTLSYATATHPEAALATPRTIARFGATGGAFLRLEKTSLGLTLATEHAADDTRTFDTFAASLSGAVTF